jgi:hypothetical protein
MTVRNRPKEAGTRYERIIADYCTEHGLPWDRASLRGGNDLLDLAGCLPMGWLVGCKSIKRGVPMSERLFSAMDQCHAAKDSLARLAAAGKLALPDREVIPVQVMRRAGAPTGRSYVVTELDWFLNLAQQRARAGW